jgi:hypothetical protein
MKSAVSIGASKKAVVAAKDAIYDILNSGQEQKTIRAALRVYERVCAVSNVSISGCQFTVGDPEPRPDLA